MIRIALLLLGVFAVFALPARAFAACTSPAGVESQTIYDTTAHIVRFCNDTSWVNFGGAGFLSGLTDVDTTGVSGSKILTYNGTTSKWVPVSGGVVQVASFSTTTAATNSASTFSSTGLTITITPTSATNKIFVRATTVIDASGNACYRQAQTVLRRSGTDIAYGYSLQYDGGSTAFAQPMVTEFLDSPNTTSAVTYELFFRRDWTSLNCAIAATAQYAGALGTITVKEVTP